MFEVYYAKFYQAVQLGKDGHTYLGGKDPKVKNAKMVYENGLLTITAPTAGTVSVPFSNIMFMKHAETEGKSGPGRSTKNTAIRSQ